MDGSLSQKIKSNYYSEFKSEALTYENFEKLYNKYKNKINVFATPFDNKSAKFLIDLGLKTIKIASGDIDNYLMFKLFNDNYQCYSIDEFKNWASWYVAESVAHSMQND